MTTGAVEGALAERTGQSLSLRASVWPRGRAPEPGMLVVADPDARTPPAITLLVESRTRDGGGFRALVHGYGCSVGEEAELWEKSGLILVGAGQAAVLLDAHTGAVRTRVPLGGYFNMLWLSEDGRDAFVCGDEQLIRILPPGVIGWQKQLGVDGVVVHRAVGATVFVSAQRRVGGPWVDYLLDRTNGNVVEAPESEEDGDTPPLKPAARSAAPVKDTRAQNVQQEADRADEDDDDASVRLVRDDETDPDDE